MHFNSAKIITYKNRTMVFSLYFFNNIKVSIIGITLNIYKPF